MKPFLAVRVARRLCIARCERGQMEGARAWGSSELEALSGGEMDGEYAAHWASADDEEWGEPPVWEGAGPMTSSGHTRSLVGQIEHLWWRQCRDLCTRAWANGLSKLLGGGSAQLLGTGAVRCRATAVRILGNQALPTRRRQQE